MKQVVANWHDFRCDFPSRQVCVCASQALSIGNKVCVVLWQEIIFKLIRDSVLVDITISVLRLPVDCFVCLRFLMFIDHGVEMCCCRQ